MAVALDDVFAITFRARLYGSRILICLHYYVFAKPPGGNVEAFCKDLATHFANSVEGGAAFTQQFIQTVCSDLFFESVRAQRVAPSRSIYEQALMTGVIGTHAGNAVPSNFAASIEKVSTTIGRHGIGRIQVAGCPISELNDASWTGVFQDNELTALGGAMLAPATIGPIQTEMRPCIYNPNPPPPHYAPITEFRVQPSVRTMHRRTLSLGE